MDEQTSVDNEKMALLDLQSFCLQCDSEMLFGGRGGGLKVSPQENCLRTTEALTQEEKAAKLWPTVKKARDGGIELMSVSFVSVSFNVLRY